MIDTFLHDRKTRGTKQTSINTYRRYLEGLEHQTRKPLQDLSSEELGELIGWIRQHYSGGGITSYLIVLKTFLKWVGHPDAASIRPPKMPHRVETDDLLTPDEIHDLIDATKNPMHRAIVALLADSAIRASELTSLHLNDIMVDGHVVTLRIRHGKGDQFRIVPIRASIPYLNRWLEVHPRKDTPTARLFPLHPVTITNILKRLAKRGGVEKNVYAHLFRHTRITDLVKREKDTRRVALISGHRSHAIDVYTHYSARDAIEVIYPELRLDTTLQPLVPRPREAIPDPGLEETVRRAVETLLPRILKSIQDEGLPGKESADQDG